MVSQSEVLTALKRLGGEATAKEIAEQMKKDGIFIYEYKHPNTISSIIATTLARCKKWGTVRPEHRKIGWTGKAMQGITTWVLVEE